jgi:hypothetical protein
MIRTRAIGTIILATALTVGTCTAWSKNPRTDLSGLNAAGRAVAASMAMPSDSVITLANPTNTSWSYTAPMDGYFNYIFNKGAPANVGYTYFEVWSADNAHRVFFAYVGDNGGGSTPTYNWCLVPMRKGQIIKCTNYSGTHNYPETKFIPCQGDA